jgi:uncharacterized 2Fe-2S/4Fe-4S cluster protein (DUF4445 family)/ferredoxin
MTMKVELVLPDGSEEVLTPDSGEANLPVSEFLARRGHTLNTRCNQRGLCRGCTVNLVEGEVRSRVGDELITADGTELDIKSCEIRLADVDRVRLAIPARSILAHAPQVEDEYVIRVPAGQDPLVEPDGDRDLGIAIDIGTTTVVVLLTDLRSGTVLARASGYNKQMKHGDNVLTRIQYCFQEPDHVRQLKEAVESDTIQPLIDQAINRAGVEPGRVACLAIAGNTTMLHLLAGVDPTSMGIAPFTPTFIEERRMTASDFGWADNGISDVPVHLLPGYAAYVGADLAAGVFATGMAYDEKAVLLVDVGTNGEIVLRREDRLHACATAAGPAFEGSGLSSGVRATQGAISGIRFRDLEPLVEFDRIGSDTLKPPIGICGTGYIDFLAAGRGAGLLTESGRFDEDYVTRHPEHFGKDDFGRKMILDRRGKLEVTVSEADIASLLQAKAAIAAGIISLLNREGIKPEQVDRVDLAGGFGRHLSAANAVACGLLPGFDPERIEAVGNTSLAGAYLALIDRTSLKEMDRNRQTVEVVELNLEPDFEDNYVDCLSLP